VFGRENIVGILLLVLCGVVCLILLNAIGTGVIPTVPSELELLFTVVGIGAALVLAWMWLSKKLRR